MAKRKLDTGVEGEGPHPRRPNRIEDDPSKQGVKNFRGVEDLKRLLAFEQDAGPHIRQSRSLSMGHEALNAKIQQEFCFLRHF